MMMGIGDGDDNNDKDGDDDESNSPPPGVKEARGFTQCDVFLPSNLEIDPI